MHVPGTFIVNLSKPVVMCMSTLNQLQSQIGVQTLPVEAMYKSDKLTPFFELLAKTSINNKVLNDAYSVVFWPILLNETKKKRKIYGKVIILFFNVPKYEKKKLFEENSLSVKKTPLA